tara:strand:- start:562 stop:741 length:180 start_codon:yes stop_codon:yes gene_type:complete
MTCDCESFLKHKDRIDLLIQEIERLHKRNAKIVKKLDYYRFQRVGKEMVEELRKANDDL